MPYLAFNLNDGNEFIFDLLEERLSLGRNPRNEIVIDNNQISSFHAEFAQQPNGAYVLTDLKSSNGTYVNGRRVESAELKPGDLVRFGQLEARFRDMYLPGQGREKKGPAPSADEKRRDAESTEGPAPQTDSIPIKKAPKEADAPLGGKPGPTPGLHPNVQPIAPTSPPPAASTTVPRPVPAPSQIVARAPSPAPSVAKAAAQPLQTTPQQPPDQTAQLPLPAPLATATTQAAQDQLAALKAEITIVQAQCDKLRVEAARLEHAKTASSAAKLELEAVRKDLETAQNQLAKYRQTESTDRERAANESKAAGESLAGLRSEIKAAEEKLSAERAAREQEHAEFSAKLSSAHQEVESLVRQRSDHSRELEKLSAERAAKEKAHAALARQQAEEGAKLQQTRQLQSGAEAKIRSLQTEQLDLRNQVSGDESRRADLAGLITALAGQRGAHEAEIGALSAERERRDGELKELAGREQELRNSAGTLRGEVETARTRFEELRKLNAEAERNLSDRRNELERAVAEKENSLRVLEERIAQSARREEDFTTKLRALAVTDSRLEEATNALSLVGEQKNALEGAITSLGRQREDREREVAALAEQGAAQHTLLQTLSKQRAGLEAEVTTLERTVEDANKRLAGIESRRAELESKAAARQAELETVRAGVAQAAADLESHRHETQAAATAKEKHLAEHDEVKSRLAAITKLLEETAARHRAAEGEAQKHQTKLESLHATAAEKASLVATLEERHIMLAGTAARFAEEEASRRDRLATLERQLGENAENLETKRTRLAEAGERLSAAEKRSLELEERLQELDEIERRLAQAKDSLTATRATEADIRAKTETVRIERETVHQELLRLQNETGLHNQNLATLHREHETEKLRLQQTRDHLERETLRAEDVRNEITVLLSTLASRQRDSEDAGNQVALATERLTKLERRLNELKDVEQHVLEAQESLEIVEKQRLGELHALDELTGRREALQQELGRLERETADGMQREFSAAEAAGQREGELAELEEQVAATRKTLAQVEDSHSAAAHALQAAKNEAQSILAVISRMNMEVAAAQTALHELVTRRTSEEERSVQLTALVISTRQEIEDVMNKLAANETRYTELLQSGDKLLSLNEALSMMETRERVASRHLSESAEQELSLQVKLNTLNESIVKEQQRLDQARRERAHEEEDRIRALEKAGRDLEEARHRGSEEAKLSEIALTTKLKERVRELEEKHEVLRRSLHASMDEKTIIVFANDLIKRIDLIDILIQRVTGPGINGGMEQQLRTLRASFEDILEQHGIAEFKVAAGTEVDVDLRQRIAIVESVSGPARPKVVESYRPGFMFSGEDGRKVVLRKVEVKTSSE